MSHPDQLPVSDTNAWAIALLPLAMGITELVLANFSDQAASITNVVNAGISLQICRADRKELLKSGIISPPSVWWFLCTPVYLWKRSTVLNTKRTSLWVMMATIIIFVIMTPSLDSEFLASLGFVQLLNACPVEDLVQWTDAAMAVLTA